MLPRTERLSRSDFSGALLKGKRFSSPHFSAVMNRDAKGVAVVVSKKTAKLSVTRHKIKRRVLGAVRSLPRTGSVVFFPKASVLEMSFADMKAELAGLLSKIKDSK